MKVSRKAISLSVLALLLLAISYKLASPILKERSIRSNIEEVFESINYCKRMVATKLAVVPPPGKAIEPIVCDGGASGGKAISVFIKNISVDGRGVISVALNHEKLGALGPANSEIVVKPLMNDATTIAYWRCGARADGSTVPVDFLPLQCTR